MFNKLQKPYVMSQVLRTYRLVRDVLYCDVAIVSDQADFQDVYHFTDPDFRNVSLSCVVGPSARRKEDLKVSSFRCSRSFVFDEIQRFIQTIRSMYEL